MVERDDSGAVSREWIEEPGPESEDDVYVILETRDTSSFVFFEMMENGLSAKNVMPQEKWLREMEKDNANLYRKLNHS